MNYNSDVFKCNFSFNITINFIILIVWIFSIWVLQLKGKALSRRKLLMYIFCAYFHRRNIETKQKKKPKARFRFPVTQPGSPHQEFKTCLCSTISSLMLYFEWIVGWIWSHFQIVNNLQTNICFSVK